MLQRQLLKEIHGCISTGKEANVYHAITETGDHRAIKGTVQKRPRCEYSDNPQSNESR